MTKHGTEHTLTFEHQEKIASWRYTGTDFKQGGALCDYADRAYIPFLLIFDLSESWEQCNMGRKVLSSFFFIGNKKLIMENNRYLKL